jgi:hypothetical protein
VNDSFIKEVLPEERLAKVVLALLALDPNFRNLTITELAALLSPYTQLELEDKAHEERVMCLADFYNLREKLMERERASFQKKSELFLQIMSRPEAGALGLRLVERNSKEKP